MVTRGPVLNGAGFRGTINNTLGRNGCQIRLPRCAATEEHRRPGHNVLSLDTALNKIGSAITGFPRAFRDRSPNLEEMRQVVLLRVMFVIAMCLLVPFGFAALHGGFLLIAAIDFIVSIFLVAATVSLRRRNAYLLVGRIATVVMGSLFLYLAATGGVSQSGYLWAFLFPLIALYFLGPVKGSLTLMVFFAALLGIALVNRTSLSRLPAMYRMRYFGVFVGIWAVASTYEYLRYRLQKKYVRRTRELETALVQLSETESALRESEGKYRSLVERANEAIALVQDGRILFANQAFSRLIGWPSQELVGRDLTSLVPSHRFGEVFRNYRGESDQKPSQNYETQLLSREGENVDIEVSRGVIDYDGRQADLILMRDIRGRKNQEQKRRRLEEHYEEIRRLESVGRLAGGVAHDFNNVLGAIAGYAEMISSRFGNADEAIGRYAGRITTGARRAADLTTKLLAFARKGAFELGPINVHHLISDVTELLRHSADKRIGFVTELHATSPVVIADHSQLQDALMAIAFNSCEAMPDGGKVRFLTDSFCLKENEHGIEGLHDGSYLRFEISDTGLGMDEETRSHLFEPFYTTKEAGRGTGLGMASVYGTIKSIGGSIEVESEVGLGTTIRLLLPSAEEHTFPENQFPASRASSGSSILVIEDEECVRTMCVQILQNMGKKVHACEDGREGVKYFEEHKEEIRLVILDHVMPRFTGFECFCRIRSIQPGMRVVVATGNPFHPDVQRMLEEGADGLLKKPFRVDELKSLVRDLTAETVGKSSHNGK